LKIKSWRIKHEESSGREQPCLDDRLHVALDRVNVVEGDEQLGWAHGPALAAAHHTQQAVEHLVTNTV